MSKKQIKEVAQELSAKWNKGDNFMALAEYAMREERENCKKRLREYASRHYGAQTVNELVAALVD